MSQTPRMNVLALSKDGERYVIFYDDESYGEMLLELSRMACDPELPFNIYDCAAMSQIAPRVEVEL